jgi:membrane protease YdiL (CAAX protease family)
MICAALCLLWIRDQFAYPDTLSFFAPTWAILACVLLVAARYLYRTPRPVVTPLEDTFKPISNTTALLSACLLLPGLTVAFEISLAWTWWGIPWQTASNSGTLDHLRIATRTVLLGTERFEIANLTVGTLMLLLLKAASEELLFRGILLRRLLVSMPPFFSLILSAAAFSILHARSGIYLISFFCAGYWLGLLYAARRSLVAPLIVHFATNILLLFFSRVPAGSNAAVTPVQDLPWPFQILLVAPLSIYLFLAVFASLRR